jgi:soluble lytic murein transglycosylase
MDRFELKKLLVKKGSLYGPVMLKDSKNYFYHPKHLKPFLAHKNFLIINRLPKDVFEESLLFGFGPKVQILLRPQIKNILKCSEEYQVDPFWLMSVIMTESNFISNAKSPKDARGLMQITPQTALHLFQLQRRLLTNDEVLKKLEQDVENIELGTFYLKKLLQNFRMNYKLATIAYNIGPNKLREKLKKQKIELNNNDYFLEVEKNYKHFLTNFDLYQIESLKWHEYFINNSLNLAEISSRP